MTKNNHRMLVIVMGLLAGSWGVAQFRAQAPPGPIEPPAGSVPATETAPPILPAPEEIPPKRESIAGLWRLNSRLSDDAREKIEQAERSTANGGIWGGSPPYGGPWGGIGIPFPGSGGPYGGRQEAERTREIEQDLRDMQEFVFPAKNITFVLKTGAAELTDDEGRERVFFTDGRKLQKPKDDDYREATAKWEGSRLVTDEKDDRGQRVRRSYELAADGRQLDEYVTLEANRYRPSVTLHFVYEILADKS